MKQVNIDFSNLYRNTTVVDIPSYVANDELDAILFNDFNKKFKQLVVKHKIDIKKNESEVMFRHISNNVSYLDNVKQCIYFDQYLQLADFDTLDELDSTQLLYVCFTDPFLIDNISITHIFKIMEYMNNYIFTQIKHILFINALVIQHHASLIKNQIVDEGSQSKSLFLKHVFVKDKKTYHLHSYKTDAQMQTNEKIISHILTRFVLLLGERINHHLREIVMEIQGQNLGSEAVPQDWYLWLKE